MNRDPRWAQGPQYTQILAGPVDPSLMQQFRATPFAPSNYTVVGAIIGGALGLIGGLIAGASAGNATIGIVLAIVGVLGGGAIMYASYNSAMSTGYRLWAFAQLNGLEYVGTHSGQHSGMLFDIGHGHKYMNVLRTKSVRPVEWGNYQYTTGSGKSQQTHRWGYMAVRLENQLPNIVLDAEGNNSLFGSNLPISFSRDQRLSLEGDFDRYFRLFCPVGYERDALYLFTPDVMVRFMDHAAELDVEIVDDWVFFYAKRDLATVDPRTWAWLYSVLDAFLSKVEQWERWRDQRLTLNEPVPTVTPDMIAAERAQMAQNNSLPVTVGQAATLAPYGSRPPNSFLGQKGVAQQGRRLKRGVGAGTVVTVLILIGYAILQIYIRAS